MTDRTSDDAVSGVRRRTRNAIVGAAVSAWARDFTTSLGEIADRAAVSRSTLHRYFPDRDALVDAALVHALGVLGEESERALTGRTGAAEQLEALMRAMIDVGDEIIFVFADPDRFAGNPNWPSSEDVELPALVERAQREGAIVGDVDPSWVIGVFYALIYTAAEALGRGEMSRHRAADVAVRTFIHGLGAG